MVRTTIGVSLLLLASCSALKGMTGSSGSKSDTGWAGSLSDAPRYEVPKVIEIKKPNCSQSGYTRLDVEQGKPFHIVAKASASCAAVEILTGNGTAANTAGNSIEVCAASGPMTVSSVGQEGGTYIGTAERYGCTGIVVTLDARPGEPTAGGDAGSPASGGGPAGGEPTEPPTL